MNTHRLLTALLASLIGLAPNVFAQENETAGWFEWPYAEPVAGSALDTSLLNEKPAGLHGRVQVRDGHFFTSDGKRLRFWGCNISSGENFPDEASAKRLARRLAQGGVNIARLHHLDNPWSVDSAGSLWTPGQPGRTKIDPAQLDRLHRLVAALKAEGIYIDVNLKVSRTLGTADGYPASIAECPSFQKRVDYFDARMIAQQKDYARQLLSAKNPYTGLSLAEDPAVAMVEINNENSLLGLRSRDVGAGLDLLPEPFRGELESLWSTWLTRHYSDAVALSKAWQASATSAGLTVLSPSSSWHTDAQPGNELSLETSSDRRALHLTLTSSDTVRWRSAAFLDQLQLREGDTYTLSFRARADRTRQLQVSVSRDEAGWRTDKWRTRGLNSVLNIGTEWSEHRLVFNAHSVIDLPSRLSFLAGHALGEVWIENLKIESGSASAGFHADQSPWQGKARIPVDATPEQWRDWLRFLSDTEASYVSDLRACLRDELGVKAPIVCSQANYGGIAGLLRERSSDFIDSHCYWQHPDFGGPTASWNSRYWALINTPQLAQFKERWFGEIGGLAELRIKGKPFTVTELDEPAPHEYACELYPEFATFAALQDWDALFPFDAVNFAQEKDPGALGSYFDQGHHPAKWGLAPFATRTFRQGLVPPLEARRELRVSASFWNDARHLDVLWLRTQPDQDLGFLSHRLEVSEELLPSGQSNQVIRHDATSPSPARMIKGPAGPVYVVEAPAAASLVGYLGGTEQKLRQLSIRCESFGLNFASLTAVALDAKPLAESKRILVSLVARAANQGAQWNPQRTSLGEQWGHGPTVVEPVSATISLHHTRQARVFPLAPDGSRYDAVPASFAKDQLSFSTKEGHRTLHYEIVTD